MNSKDIPAVPPPPDGHATWLDAILRGSYLFDRHVLAMDYAAAELAELQAERDSLRAQVAELRGAILGLGELTGTEVHTGWGPTLRVHLNPDNLQSFNAWVARLRAEPLPGAGEPAAGEEAGR